MFGKPDLDSFVLSRHRDRLPERIAGNALHITPASLGGILDVHRSPIAEGLCRLRIGCIGVIFPKRTDVLVGAPMTETALDRPKLGVGLNPVDDSNCRTLQPFERVRRSP